MGARLAEDAGLSESDWARAMQPVSKRPIAAVQLVRIDVSIRATFPAGSDADCCC
jgi:hypothetical protein